MFETDWPEPRVKKEVKRVMGWIGAAGFMPAANGFGVSGVADFVFCWSSLFIAIETKGITSGPLRADQIEFGKSIIESGGVWLHIDHKNIRRLPLILISSGIGIGRWKGFRPCLTRSKVSTRKRKLSLQ